MYHPFARVPEYLLWMDKIHFSPPKKPFNDLIPQSNTTKLYGFKPMDPFRGVISGFRDHPQLTSWVPALHLFLERPIWW